MKFVKITYLVTLSNGRLWYLTKALSRFILILLLDSTWELRGSKVGKFVAIYLSALKVKTC